LGSTSSGIILLINREFIRWVVYANLIAWPLTYWAARKWLQSFAYRTGIGIDVFFAAALLAVLLAILTVSVQSVRAANTNPIESLRYE
jgi:putative ABC transport system permease protein